MNKIRIIINLLLGKDIVVYDNWHKEVLVMIGGDYEVFKKRYNYAFIDKNTPCLKDVDGIIYYTGDNDEV